VKIHIHISGECAIKVDVQLTQLKETGMHGKSKNHLLNKGYHQSKKGAITMNIKPVFKTTFLESFDNQI
jgi:hypothetical protein